jgi:carboxylate-amine ligase
VNTVRIGVEEEFHLVDAETLHLRSLAELAERAGSGAAGPALHREMLTSQLEAVTEVCDTLADVRAAVTRNRRLADQAAAQYGATILATSTHPFAQLDECRVAGVDRYHRLVERFGAVVGEFNLCGCHVHVSVPDLTTAVAILNHARPYLPLLAALTSSSPFHAGIDTGYASFRAAQLALWPQGGTPPFLDSADAYLDSIARLTGAGLIDDASMLLWELRPSLRYPTLEFRVADSCTDVDDVVLHAGLARALVRTLAARVADGQPAPRIPEAELRAARWRAARYGLDGALWDPVAGTLVAARDAAESLWCELLPDLDAHGEAAELRALLDGLLRRGTSATWQRQKYAETGDLREVTRDGVRRTLTMTDRPSGTRTAPARTHP